jgi:hypothetical protein
MILLQIIRFEKHIPPPTSSFISYNLLIVHKKSDFWKHNGHAVLHEFETVCMKSFIFQDILCIASVFITEL